jgi:hypothetical protein
MQQECSSKRSTIWYLPSDQAYNDYVASKDTYNDNPTTANSKAYNGIPALLKIIAIANLFVAICICKL